MSPTPRQLQRIMVSNQASGREGIAAALEKKAGKTEGGLCSHVLGRHRALLNLKVSVQLFYSSHLPVRSEICRFWEHRA